MSLHSIQSPDRYPSTVIWAFLRAKAKFREFPQSTVVVEEARLQLGREAERKKKKPVQKLIEIERRRVGSLKRSLAYYPLHPLHEFIKSVEIRAYVQAYSDGLGLRLTFTRLDDLHECCQAALSK